MPPSKLLRFLLLLVWSGVLLATASPTLAQAGLAGQPLDMCVAPARDGQTVAQMFGRPAAFDCTSPQVYHGPGTYWVLSAPVSTVTSARDFRVRTGSLWQSALTLAIRYADGVIVTIPTTSATLSRHVQLGAILEFTPPVRAAPVDRLLWRVEGSANLRGLVLGQRIASPSDSIHANLMMATIYAAFAGLAFALLVYNLSLWGALRHRFQLAYCAMVIALLGYAFTSSGILAWIVPTIDNNDRIRINYALLGIAAGGAVMFARTFFEPRVFAGWLGRTTYVAAAGMAISGVSFALLSQWDVPIANRFSSVLFLVSLLIVLPILWSAWLRGSRYLWLFAIAWAAPVLFAGARILSSLHFIPANFWLDNSTVLSLGFEALVSSLAIAYRVQMLSRERDDALAGEVQARKLADADPLTGLLNRRAFPDQALGRAGPQMLHLIDIDHFKAVNDTLGHDGGDEVLRVFARTLRSAVPSGGLIARLGGEEFAVVVPHDSPLVAESLLERLRSARMPFDLTVTSSIGSCVGSLLLESDWKMLYRNADRALFEAKTAGRDRSRLAPALPIAA